MYIGATACFIGSVAYLVRPSEASDAFGRTGAEAAIVFGAILLTTGPLWGAKAWGAFFWTWDSSPDDRAPQLPHLRGVRRSAGLREGDGPGERRASPRRSGCSGRGRTCRPIIHFQRAEVGGQQLAPMVVTGNGGGLQHPAMKTALWFGFLAFTLLAVLLIWLVTRIEIGHGRLRAAEEDAIDLGLDTRTGEA